MGKNSSRVLYLVKYHVRRENRVKAADNFGIWGNHELDGGQRGVEGAKDFLEGGSLPILDNPESLIDQIMHMYLSQIDLIIQIEMELILHITHVSITGRPDRGIYH